MKVPHGIKLLILDVDGVLTDGTIIMDDNGKESKQFHARDGLGLYMLHHVGVRTALISGRTAEVVEHRARQLKIEEVHQGIGDKLTVYEKILEKNGLADKDVCYMGDDLIDLAPMKRAGFPAAPADAHPLVLEVAHMVTRARGGRGAVREVIEALIRASGAWKDVLELFNR